MEKIQGEIQKLKTLLELSVVNSKMFLSIEEAALYLAVSKSHLYKLTSKKEIPFYQPGGKKIYFKREELEQWIIDAKMESVGNIENEVQLYLGRNKNTSL